MRWWFAVACLAGALGCNGLDTKEPPGLTTTRTTLAPDGGAAPMSTDRDAVAAPMDNDAGAPAGSAEVPEAPAKLDLCATPPVLSPALRLAPVDPGQRYVRCGTYGPELGWHVTLSPAGRFLAAQTSAGTVRLIDVQQWREVVQLASPVGRLDAVAFSPDGQHLATLSAEAGEVTLWRTSDGDLERSWALTPASTIDATRSSLAFSSDGRTLATSLGDNPDPHDDSIMLQVIDTAGPAAIQTPQVDPENMALGMAFPAMKFVGNDAMLLVQAGYQVGNSPGSTRLSLYRAPSGPEIALYDAYSRDFDGYAVSPDGQLIAFASGAFPGSGLYVVRAATGETIASDTTFGGSVLGFAPDRTAFYVQQGDVVLSLAAKTLEPLGSFPLAADAVFRAIAPNGDLVTTSASSTSWWDPATGAVTRTLPFAIDQIVWSQDGALEIVTGGGALFQAFRTADGTALCSAPAASPAIRYVATSPASTQIGYAYDDGTVEVESATAPTGATRFKANTPAITDLALSDDGTRVAVNGTTPSGNDTPTNAPTTIYDVATGSVLQQLNLPYYEVTASVLSTDGKKYALGVVDATTFANRARAIDVDSGQVLLDLQPSSLAGYDVPDVFNVDGSELAVASEQNLGAWRLSDATLVKTFEPGIITSPPGIRAVSTSWLYKAGTAGDGLAVFSVSDTGEIRAFTTTNAAGPLFPNFDKLFTAAVPVTHTHAVDYASEHIWEVQSGVQLRVLPASPAGGAGTLALPGDGEQLLTLDNGAVDIWCR